MDGEKHADRDLPVWHHLAPLDSRESVLVRDAHDGGFVTKLRPDVRAWLFLRCMSHGLCAVVAWFLQRWCTRGVRPQLAS